jgi:hypothetical protein
MPHRPVSRRKLLTKGAAAGAILATGSAKMAKGADGATPPPDAKSRFTFCLNTSTIRGQKIPLAKEIELAAKAGFTAMEPWVAELNDHVKQGGDLKDLRASNR